MPVIAETGTDVAPRENRHKRKEKEDKEKKRQGMFAAIIEEVAI